MSSTGDNETLLRLAPPGRSAPPVVALPGFEPRRLPAEEAHLQTTSPPEDNFIVPGFMQLVYCPRHVTLQRISTAIRMPIRDVGMRSEQPVGHRARLIVGLPPSMPGGEYENHEFIGDVMLTEFAAIEDAAERAIDFLCNAKHVRLDDANYECKLMVAESFQMLHMEAAQQAHQSMQSLIQEVEEMSHGHDTLLWLNRELQHQNEARDNQQAQIIQQLTLQNGVLTHAIMAQQIEALTQQNVSQGQDLENTNLQLQLSLQANVALQQANVALQHAHDGLEHEHGSLHHIHGALDHDHGELLRRRAVLYDRYSDAMNKAEFMAENSAGFILIEHRKGCDFNGKPILVPVYTGNRPPKEDAEHLANAIVKLAVHRLETERALLQ